MNRPTLLPGQRRVDYGRQAAERDAALHEESSQMRDKQHGNYEIMLHDNSFSAFRGWGDGLLFIEELPHRIRPAEETGVKVREDNSQWALSVNDPMERPEYALDSLQLKSDHTLCVVCKDTLNYFCRYIDERGKWLDIPDSDSDTTFTMKSNVVHHGSLWPLFVFGDIIKQKCVICTEICAKIEATYPNLPPARYQQYQIECCWSRRPNPLQQNKMWFLLVDPSTKKDPLWNWQPVLRMALWPKAQFGHHFHQQDGIVPSRGPWDVCANDGTNDATSTRSLALQWLARCQRNADGQHALCSRQDGNFLPTRLLDVRKALQTGKVCLVIPSEQALNSREYLTLSHCWGSWGAQNNPVLLSDNLRSRQKEGLAWDALPQTFRDAFKITSWFGWDWLWIDSLCIIQDSTDDWKREAAMMDKVYQNSQVNISADSGEDSRAGCFSHREKDDITPLELSSAEGGPWQVTTENAFAWMQSATSLSRAWIHRERQLSRRILHFTDKEVVWECCGLGNSGFASETMPGGAPFKEVFGGDTKFQIQWSEAGDPGDKDRLDSIYRLWNTTCEGLSNKSVTYATDLPIILSSLAKEVHRMIPEDEYICGLWKSTLPQSLNWWTPDDRPDDIKFVAPSWSWLNVAVPVHMATHHKAQNKLPVAEIIRVDIECDSDPYGSVTKGELQMKGYLRRLHFYFVNDNRFILSVIEEEDGEDRLRLIGPDWNEKDGQTCQLTHDGIIRLDYQEHECYAFLTTLAETGQDLPSCERELSCLLLDAVDSKENVYKRIGSLNGISDDYSFKLRYSVKEGGEAGLSRLLHVENDIAYQGPESADTTTVQRKVPDIWNLLAEFVRRYRWIAIAWENTKEKEKEAWRKRQRERENRKASQTGDESSEDAEGDSEKDSEESAAEEEGEEEEESTGVHSPASEPSSSNGLSRPAFVETDKITNFEELRKVTYRSLIRQIRKHPSSGPQSSTDDDERQMVQEVASILPTTEAFGSELPPAQALYQFDEVLDEWRDRQRVVPWLERLDVVDIILI